MSLIILGGGLTGLACAHFYPGPSVLFEKEHTLGGVARSFRRQDFIFDCTGHWLHLRSADMQRLVHQLLGDNLLEIQRRAEIYSHGVRTPYPFQANTHGLPTDVVASCVLGYFRARQTQAAGDFSSPKHFEDYIRQTMGDGIAEHFMLPYNSKLWTISPKEMSYDWCKRFVPTPTPEEVVHGALSSAGAGHALGYNSRFLYPKRGGIGVLAESLGATLQRTRLHTGVEISKVDWQHQRVHTSGGDIHQYSTLVSTLPLNLLVASLANPPEAIAAAAEKLRAISVTHWDVGVRGANGATDPHWIYFPENNVPFYRVGAPSAAVSGVAPAGCRSYYVEVSHRQNTPCPATDEAILQGLKDVGLLGKSEEPVLFAKSTIPCAYVLMDQHYGAAREILLAWLEGQGIHPAGRYGRWMYDSMEGALLQGQRLAARLAVNLA